jgi:REP element-mobilizing transposase RayT
MRDQYGSAHHVICGAYGFWLPNDPRGSWSQFVGAWELFRYGAATTTAETRSLARLEHDVDQRMSAKQSLKYPAVNFSGVQARAVGRGFANYVQHSGLQVWACAILPTHVHLVVARFRLKIEQVVIQLKGEATQQLVEEELHPFQKLRDKHCRRPKCWARGEWNVFLESAEDIERALAYVEENPVKEGKPAQQWSLVSRFDPTSIV